MFLRRNEILDEMREQSTTNCGESAKVVAVCLASQTLILRKRDYEL